MIRSLLFCAPLFGMLLSTFLAFAEDHPLPAEAARQWQQRAKTAIAAMEEQIVNERELAAGRLVDQMVKCGAVDDAVAVANAMGISRLNVLLNVGNQLATAKQREAAQRVAAVIEKALTESLSKTDLPAAMKGGNLRGLVGLYAGLGDFEQARKTLARITPELDGESTHITMRGGVTIPAGRLRAESLWEIAMNQVAQGDLAAAEKTIAEIELRPIREAALWTTVKGLATNGRCAEALTFARQIPSCDLAGKIYVITSAEGPEERDVASFRTDAYDTILLEQAKSQDLAAAKATLDLIPASRHAMLLDVVARSLVEDGSFDRALEVATWRPNPELTEWVFAAQARRQAQGGKLSEALATLKKIELGPQRVSALLVIADQQLETKDLAAARASLQEVQSIATNVPVTVKLEMMLEVARLLAKSGDRAAAFSRLAEIAREAEKVPDAERQDQLLYFTAVGYGKCDELKQAEALLAKLKYPGIAAHAWVEIAKEQGARGLRDDALAPLHKALEKTKSIDFAMPLDWPVSKPHNLRDVGGAMVSLDLVPELETLLRSETDSLVKAYLTLGAAEAFPLQVPPAKAHPRER